MATWAEFEQAAPRIADAGRHLIYQYGPGLGFLATVRKDGGPRLHPMCPILAEDEMWAFIVDASPKCADLRRDGRFAVHAFTPENVDDEFLVMGTAHATAADAERRQRIAAATSASVGADTESLFRFDIDRALLSTYTHRGRWPPTYQVWRA
jgi:Pyridoxamine 5'-phosphate oxidase